MVNLQNRSYQKELLDRDDIPFEDIKQNMKELNTVNSFLGGHAITITGIKEILRNKKITGSLLICEIGCGGGDNLKAIHDYCSKANIPVRFIGIDLKKECIDFANRQYPDLPALWITSDYLSADFDNVVPDILFSSLFSHHFTNDQLIIQLKWMRKNCRLGFFINDLHRNIIAYYSIKWITSIVSRSYLVKNDAPLSVARGFRKMEWLNLLQTAGCGNAKVSWKWAFRYLLIFNHG